MKEKLKYILASSSPRRIKLFKLAKLNFKAIKSNVNEDLLVKKYKKSNYADLVKILSLAKAISVLPKLKGNEIVCAFDTIVVCNKKIIRKPKNKKDALKKLLFLSNKQHDVITGIALINLKKKNIIVDFEITKVVMKKISRNDALKYIKTKEPLDKAGAYAIQGRGKKFVKRIRGDYFNVIGLPLKRFLKDLNTIH